MQMEARNPNPLPAWVVPTLVAVLAVPTFAAFWLGGRPGLGAVWAAVQIGFALVLVVGGRSDTIQMLRGSADDERTLALEAQAMSITGGVLTFALAGLFLAEGIRGNSGLTYAALLVAAEVVHLIALAMLNRRS